MDRMKAYYEIQFYLPDAKLWKSSSQGPVMDAEVDVLEVWKAYTRYLSLAYPDMLYRLVLVSVTCKEEPIHV